LISTINGVKVDFVQWLFLKKLRHFYATQKRGRSRGEKFKH